MLNKLKYAFLFTLSRTIKWVFGGVFVLYREVNHALDDIKLRKFESRASDIFIVTYPKAGTTWMQNILFQLTTKGDLDDIDHIMSFSPHLDEELEQANKMTSQRILKTHLAHDQISVNPAAKYIYVVRDGMDTAISYYQHYQSNKNYQGTFDQFYDQFMTGKVAYGSWFKHLQGWGQRKNQANFLFINYQDLKNDLEKTIKSIAVFLQLEIPTADLERILAKTSFDYMKKHEYKFSLKVYMQNLKNSNSGAFINKGEVGRGKKIISAEQQKRFECELNKYQLGEEQQGIL